MVYGAAYCRLSDKEKLSNEGYTDSKLLTEAKREEYFEKIKQREGVEIG